MKNSIRTISLLIAMVVVSFQAKAQFHFGINAMGTMPMSHWAEDSIAKFGTNPFYGNAAKFGAGIGLRFGYDFSWRYNGILTPFIDIDGMWNQKSKVMKDIADPISFTLGHYINGSAVVGASYRYFFNYQKPIIGLFLEGAIGADVLCVTQEGWEGNPQKYKPSVGFAIRIGGGICLTPRVNLGIHYSYLGNHNIDKSVEGSEFPQNLELRIPDKLKEPMLVLKLTYIVKGNKIKHLPLRNSPM